MKTTVQQWGNSQGIRVPKSCLETVGLHVGDELEMAIKGDRIELRPARRAIRGRYRIEDLAARMPARLRLKETRVGGPVGREVW
ncbi:MAG: AbrB/MazE/SpoVT family DNA-binding domain-containing protein [Verrucomicrobia bacterium]|nr:AbrB/MazE/SpoVT family DNA-binding domain-containing protein [Verrucomicrobiota bacterium]